MAATETIRFAPGRRYSGLVIQRRLSGDRIWGGSTTTRPETRTDLDRVGTFDQQYPSNHNAFSLVDLFGFQNIKQRRVNLKLTPEDNLLVLLQGGSLHTATTKDAVYRVRELEALDCGSDGWLQGRRHRQPVRRFGEVHLSRSRS